MDFESKNLMYIYKEDYEQIVEYAKIDFPNESCGLLGGIVNGDIWKVEKVYHLTNLDASSVHFSMDPKEQFEAIRDMRANGWMLIGNFHSHPNGPAILSDEDIRLAYDTQIKYLVLSLTDFNKPILKGFEKKDASIKEIKIKYIEKDFIKETE